MKKNLFIVGLITVIFGVGLFNSQEVDAAKTNIQILEEVIGTNWHDLHQTTTQQSMGAIAQDFGKLDEFQQKMLESKEEQLNELVAAGKMDQSEADTIITTIKQKQHDCTGNSECVGLHNGVGIGHTNHTAVTGNTATEDTHTNQSGNGYGTHGGNGYKNSSNHHSENNEGYNHNSGHGHGNGSCRQ